MNYSRFMIVSSFINNHLIARFQKQGKVSKTIMSNVVRKKCISFHENEERTFENERNLPKAFCCFVTELTNKFKSRKMFQYQFTLLQQTEFTFPKLFNMNSLQVGAEDIFVVHRSRNKRVLLNFKANIVLVNSSLLYNGIS